MRSPSTPKQHLPTGPPVHGSRPGGQWRERGNGFQSVSSGRTDLTVAWSGWWIRIAAGPPDSKRESPDATGARNAPSQPTRATPSGEEMSRQNSSEVS